LLTYRRVRAEPFCAGRIGAKVMAAWGQHQLRAALGAYVRQAWTVVINHRRVSGLLLLCTDALPTKWVLGLFRMQLMGRHMSLNNLLDLRGAILEYSIKTSDAWLRHTSRP